MCGLVGVVAFDPRWAIGAETLTRVSARIAHRGPDGEGQWLNPDRPDSTIRVALAHRRLAILDPDPRSNQPFTDGRRWLVFNGEIYNFRELRRQLSPRIWQTTGDTEVLLAAYEAWGERCVDHLNGMFALAIWDGRDNTLFLARDRMGQKPLYIALAPGERDHPGGIAFASEIGPLLEIDWIDKSTDQAALLEYLRWGYIPTPRTIYRGITQLPAARTLLISPLGTTRRDYFHPGAMERTTGTARSLVRQAVARQLVSDVPLGCFLSGGIDSSVIAAAMKASVPADQKILTFAIGFEDSRYDETAYAARVAAHLKTEHRQFIVHPDAAAVLPAIAAAFGQPMADSSAIPTYYLARETRGHVKVALSGDGGDELFGGYDRYRALRLLQITGRWPWRIIAPLLDAIPGSHPKSAAARLKRLAASANLPPAQRYAAYMRMFDESSLQSLLSEPATTSDPDFIERAFTDALRNKDVVEAALAVDRLTYLPDDLLTKVDRCSMLHALEVRSPFMDHELVQFAGGLDAASLLRGGGKRLLREAFAADLPAWVFRRRKMGFAVPIGSWLRESLRPMLGDLLFAADSFAANHFRRAGLEAILQEHQTETRDHSQRLYALLMLEIWWRQTRNS